MKEQDRHRIESEDAKALRGSWQGDPFEKLRKEFSQYPLLTSELDIGGLTAPNRFVHQPMECDDSPNGFPSDTTLARYRRLGEGHAGITVVEATSVGSKPKDSKYKVSGQSRVNQLVADERHKDGIKQVVDAFRSVNDKSVLCVQLTHAGQIADPRFSEVVRIYEPEGFDDAPGSYLGAKDIEQITGDFIKAAEVVKDAGVEIVDFKNCHGYLGGQMLRPANTRRDEYGGSLDNRMEFARRVIEGIKEIGLRVMVRFSMYEGDRTVTGTEMKGAIGTTGPDSVEYSLDEPLEMLRKFAEFGADCLNITAGIPARNAGAWVRPSGPPEGFEAGDPTTYGKYHHFEYAKAAMDLDLGIPIIASGFSLFRDQFGQVAENVIAKGYANMVGDGRQTLVDADLRRLLAGDAKYCGSCAKPGCAELLLGQMPVGCPIYYRDYKAKQNSLRVHFTAPWLK